MCQQTLKLAEGWLSSQIHCSWRCRAHHKCVKCFHSGAARNSYNLGVWMFHKSSSVPLNLWGCILDVSSMFDHKTFHGIHSENPKHSFFMSYLTIMWNQNNNVIVVPGHNHTFWALQCHDSLLQWRDCLFEEWPWDGKWRWYFNHILPAKNISRFLSISYVSYMHIIYAVLLVNMLWWSHKNHHFPFIRWMGQLYWASWL